MATTIIEDQCLFKPNTTKPSAIIKPLMKESSNCTAVVTKRPPLVSVQHGMNTRSKRETAATTGVGGCVKAVRGRREVGTRNRCTTGRQATTGVENSAIVVKREEEEDEVRNGKGEVRVAVKTTRIRAAITRMPKPTKTDQNRPLNNKLSKLDGIGIPQRTALARVSSTRNTTTSTVTAAQKMKNPRPRPSLVINKPPQVTELAAEDADIRKTDCRYVSKRSKKPTTINTRGMVI